MRASAPFLAIAALLVALPLSADEDVDQRTQRLVARAEKALASSRFEDALELYDRAREVSADTSFAARLGVARATLALERFEESATAARAALDLASGPLEEARSHTAIGQAFFGARAATARTEDPLRRLEQRERVLRSAERAFRHALTLAAPAVPEARYGLAFLLLERGEFDEGVTELRLYASTLGDPEIARFYGCIDGVAASGRVAAILGADARPLHLRFDPPPGARARRFVPSTEVVKYLVDSSGEVACIITLGGAGLGRSEDFLERVREALTAPPLPQGSVPTAELGTLELVITPP